MDLSNVCVRPCGSVGGGQCEGIDDGGGSSREHHISGISSSRAVECGEAGE